MRVLYDGVIYRIQRYGGVVRYFNGLIRHLPSSINPILLAPCHPAVAPQNPNLSTHIETCETLLWPIKPLRKKIIAYRSYNRVTTEEPDVIHPTYYYSSLRHLNERINVPTVLTVFDLIHEKFPKQMDPYGKQIRLKQQALERADAIVCISESTRNDLLNHYFVPEEKIRVIYPGCEFPTVDDCSLDAGSESAIISRRPTHSLDRRYLLFVGERGFYKNFERLLKAFAQVSADLPDLELRCVGGKPFTRQEKQLMSELKIMARVSWCGQLPDVEMQQSYSKALAVIYPSLYEGFGIPILEAMTCGTAVLTSNRASMPEVAGEAAILFDPYCVDEMAEAIRHVTDDDSAREDLVRRGLLQAKKFSLQKSAEQITEVYRSIARCAEVAA